MIDHNRYGEHQPHGSNQKREDNELENVKIHPAATDSIASSYW